MNAIGHSESSTQKASLTRLRKSNYKRRCIVEPQILNLNIVGGSSLKGGGESNVRHMMDILNDDLYWRSLKLVLFAVYRGKHPASRDIP